MLNVMEVADTLVNHIKSHYSEDVALVAYYGSYVQGTATKRSDLDFFFIPATSRGYEASIQFVLDDISFDFWPISWERAERMASFQEPMTSIIADCVILYVRSDSDLERFNKLRTTIGEIPQQGLKLVEKAEERLRDAYVHLYKLSRMNREDNLTLFRIEAHGAMTNVLNSLALLNGTYFTKAWGKNSAQILNFPMKPAHLEGLMDTIMSSQSSKEIREACEQLTQNTLELLLKQKETYTTESSYPDRMNGIYEEFKGMLDKVLTACEANDYSTAYHGSVIAQEEIARFLYFAENGYWSSELDPSLAYQAVYRRAGLPDLVALLDPQQLASLYEAVKDLDSLLESHLCEHGVNINRFQDLAQFAAFLEQSK
ncbi:nucleotidyltransferase domain-containing protein [Paenibacillus marinisediminis]